MVKATDSWVLSWRKTWKFGVNVFVDPLYNHYKLVWDYGISLEVKLEQTDCHSALILAWQLETEKHGYIHSLLAFYLVFKMILYDFIVFIYFMQDFNFHVFAESYNGLRNCFDTLAHVSLADLLFDLWEVSYSLKNTPEIDKPKLKAQRIIALSETILVNLPQNTP